MNKFMKNFRLLPLALVCLSLGACLSEEDETTEGNESLIPTNIVQSGVRGSWSHTVVSSEGGAYTPNTLASEWYVETNRTTIASICDFGDRTVSAVVQVSSRIQGSILTLLDSSSKIIQDGEKVCSAAATDNTSYVLNLMSTNRLNITRTGITTDFSRIEPIPDDERN